MDTAADTAGTRPTIIVTGASSGIGRATALTLAGHGFRVFAGVRDPRDGDALHRRDPHIIPLALDVTDAASIAAAGEVVGRAVGAAGLAGLVNNAGIGVAGPLEYMPIDDVRRQFDVNVFGLLAATQAFLPLLRRGQGRIVNIGSVGSEITMPFGGALCATKHAVLALTAALRLELRPWGIRVCLIEPGEISTPAAEKAARDGAAFLERLPAEGHRRYGAAFAGFLGEVRRRERGGSPPEAVAAAVHAALTARVPRTRYPAGSHARLLVGLARAMPDRLLDAALLRLLHLPHAFGAERERAPAGS